jgi:DNA-binding IclR family transcriptional regulator
MKPKEAIESGLGSIGKVKILRALAEENKMATLYTLHKKTGLKRDDIKSNLDDLVRIGWIKETKYANALYGLDLENEYVARLVQFFRDTGYIGQP